MRFIKTLTLGLLVSGGAQFAAAQVIEPVAGKTVPVNKLIMGLNDNAGTLHNAFRAGNGELYWDSYKVANPGIIRFPGGTVASLWDYENDCFIDPDLWEERLGKTTVWMSWTMELAKSVNGSEDRKHLDPIEFYNRAVSVGAEVVWVVNMATDLPKQKPHAAVKFVKRLVDADIPVKYIEIGNEFEGASFVERWPSVEDYLKEIDPIVKQIRKLAPGVKLAYPSSVSVASALESDANNQPGHGDGRHGHWAKVTQGRKDGIDLVNHTYIGVKSAKQSLGLKNYVAWVRAEKTDPELGVRFLAQSPSFMIQSAVQYMAKSDKKIWQTEYNIWMPKGRSGGWEKFCDTMANALYLANWKILMLQHPETFEMANWHSLSGATFGFIRTDEGHITASPAVQVFSDLSTLVKQSVELKPLRFKNDPGSEGLLIWEGHQTRSLEGILLKMENGKLAAVIMNNSNKPISISLKFAGTPNVKGFSIAAADPLNKVRAKVSSDQIPVQGPLKPVKLAVTNGQVTLPPFSYNRMIW